MCNSFSGVLVTVEKRLSSAACRKPCCSWFTRANINADFVTAKQQGPKELTLNERAAAGRATECRRLKALLLPRGLVPGDFGRTGQPGFVRPARLAGHSS
jgi:hypothetical protein